MDWIERLFGVSLDGGNGSAETAILLTVAFSCLLVYLSLRRFRRPG